MLFAMPRTAALSLLTGALVALACPMPASGAVQLSVGEASLVTIHGPEETLRDFCVTQDGTLWLMFPDGTREELVTSIDDPAILNKGDGSFHPFEENQVRAALAALRAPLAHLRVEVFLLPFPRRGCVPSSATPGRIILSPGVRALSPEHQHAEFVHELGHVVHFSRMPETEAGWASYRELRGITDEGIYNAVAAHANRPHEIFAEDFRALIGGSMANYSGTIENAGLAAPTSVSGLADYMRSVAAASGAMVHLAMACYPNPSREAVSFVVPGGSREALEVYDLGGRRVTSLGPVVAAGVTTWRWDGRDASGAPAGVGVYFARTASGSAALRVTRVR